MPLKCAFDINRRKLFAIETWKVINRDIISANKFKIQ